MATLWEMSKTPWGNSFDESHPELAALPSTLSQIPVILVTGSS